MDDLIKILYEHEFSEAQRIYGLSPEEKTRLVEQDEICEKLGKKLSEGDRELLDKLSSLSGIISGEERYSAFCRGIKTVSRLLVSVLFLDVNSH